MDNIDESDVRVATVTELWRYPVKSMQGEIVPAFEVGTTGVVGDRRFAVTDRATGRVLSAKTAPRLLEAAATTVDGEVWIALADGISWPAGDAEAAARLSSWLDREVVLSEVDDGTRASYEMTFDPPNDDAELVDIPSPDGTFLDLAALHLLSTNSLATCAATGDASAWDRRRFRPNVLVSAISTEPYPEDAWVGRTLAVGAAAATVLMRTVRCAMPLRGQPPHPAGHRLARDVNVFRTLSREHDNHLGVYASVHETGVVHVGDTVTLAATTSSPAA
jgi:MOSC domain-containing protein